MRTSSTFIENNLNLLRRVSQLLTLLVLVSIPLGGVLAIDVETQSLSVLGNRIWPHEFHLMAAGVLMLLVLLGGFSLFLGRFFCGWMCPQTFLSEIATAVQSLLASREEGNRLRRYATAAGLTVLALLLAALAAFAFVSFFVSQQALVELAQGKINTSLLKAIVMVGFLFVVLVGLLRHTFCEWMCLFGWWQRLFTGERSIRVAFDVRRGKDCTRCDGCKNICFMGIDPRKRNLPPTCLNCGKCVTACHKELAPAGKPSLIWYYAGHTPGRASAAEDGQPRRGNIKTTVFALVCALATGFFVWGITSRPPIELKIRQAEAGPVALVDGRAKGEFFVDVYNNGSESVALSLVGSGLPTQDVTFEPRRLLAEPNDRMRVRLSFDTDSRSLRAGRNELLVNAVPEADPESSYFGRLIFGLPFVAATEPAIEPATEPAIEPATETAFPSRVGEQSEDADAGS